jgi:uncharacterized protein GlcG (DUF336 family)
MFQLIKQFSHMKNLKKHHILLAVTTVFLAQTASLAQSPAATFSIQSLTPEAALTAAQAALAACRKAGAQVAVAVTDRQGLTLVVLRDRNAGAHTPDTAVNKAWTAASFKISTQLLGVETQAGKSMSAIRSLPRVMAAGGGLPILAPSGYVGAIGVSGAPSGALDEDCAQAGIAAIYENLLFAQ